MLKLRGIVWGMVVGVVLGGMVGVAAGQDEVPRPGQPGGSKVALNQVTVQAPVTAPDFTLTVDFPGGTVGQYVQLLKQASGRNAVNVVMSRAATDIQIGTISMRDVTLYTALSAIQAAAGRDTQWRVQPLTGVKGVIAEAYALEFASSQNRTMSSSGDSGIKVFSIRNLTDPMPGDPPGVKLTKTPEVVLTAVRAALDLTGDRADAAEMKYHEDSGLLIIHGNNEQVGAVSQTLHEMELDVRNRRDAARSNMAPGVDIIELQTQVRKLAVMVGQRQRDLDRMQAAAERAKTLMTAGQMSQGDYAEVVGKLDAAKSEMEVGTIDLERAKTAYAEATKGAGGGRDGRIDELQARLDALGQMAAQMQELMDRAKRDGGHDDQVASLRKQVDDLSAQRNQVSIELSTLRRLQDIESQKNKEKSRSAVDSTGEVDHLRSEMTRIDQMVASKSQERRALIDKGSNKESPEVKAMDEQIRRLVEEKGKLAPALAAAQGQGDQVAARGKSVAVYDLPPMDAKAREQLISAIKGLETAINNPERLKVQSAQESKLVIEADGAMHEVVRGMLKEVSGARGQPDSTDGKKPRGTK